MKDLEGRIAVVTGGARGIGRALAEACLQEGMHVVIADCDEEALAETASALEAVSSLVTPVRTDVSDAASVDGLAHRADGLDGQIGLVFNNAGVTASSDLGSLWEATPSDWQRLVDTNLWGVIHGCRSFLPLMMAQAEPSRIVNTASIAGVISAPPIAIYTMTKHAVVSLSENLDQQLERENASVRASVICPGFVRTNLIDTLVAVEGESPVMRENRAWFEERVADGTDPVQIAARILDGIRHGRRYIFTHTGFRQALVERHERILEDLDAATPADTSSGDP